MKNTTLLLAVILTIFSCKKETPKEPFPLFFGEVTTLVNETEWEMKPFVQISQFSEDAIYFHLRTYLDDNYNYITSSMYVQSVPLSIGSHTLNRNSLEYTQPFARYHLLEHDYPLREYALAEGDFTNQISITDYDEETQAIEGTFQMTFIVIPEDSLLNTNFPDTIVFKNGHFTSKVFENCDF